MEICLWRSMMDQGHCLQHWELTHTVKAKMSHFTHHLFNVLSLCTIIVCLWGMQLWTAQTSDGSSINVTYPNILTCGKNTICTMNIETNVGFKVHLSTIHAKYSGEYNTDYCSFAGVSAHDSGNEISSFCPKQSQSIEGSDYTFPTIYSSGYTLLIVFYSYKEYGTMNVNLTISRTLCQAIQINVCKLVYSNPLLGLFCTKTG